MRPFALGVLVVAGCSLYAQYPPAPGSALPTLVQGDEQFGVRLLREVHRTAPDRDIVVASLPLTLFFTSIQEWSQLEATQSQIGAAFGWGRNAEEDVASAMLLAALSKPTARELAALDKARKAGRSAGAGESVWLENQVYFHRLPNGTSPVSRHFSEGAAKWFGLSFIGLPHKPTVDDLTKETGTAAVGATSPENDIVYRSAMHAQMLWRGNLFRLTEPFTGQFQPEHGDTVKVQMQKSELASYLYARTDLYEAAVLPCYNGAMTVVLPNEGHTVNEVESRLAERPQELAAVLTRQQGNVTITMFHLKVDNDLRPALEGMGIREPFVNLGDLVKGPRPHLTEVKQRVDLLVNQEGIVGDSETIVGVTLGGVFGARDPFDMKVNRPFIFLIREQETGALLYAGAVMHPNQR